MITPADEDSAFLAIKNDLYRNISARTFDADTLRPIFSDNFVTPTGLPENTTYFNKIAELAFNSNNLNGLNSLNGLNPFGNINQLNPFNNYLDTVKQSLLNCNIPPLPTASLLPSVTSLSQLLNVNIFDSILKKVSTLPKVGLNIGPNIVGILTSLVQSNLTTLLGPFAGYLKTISACIKKF
jgi:hypothetical protein